MDMTQGLWPEFSDRIREFILHANYNGMNVDIQSGLRTMQQQQVLYNKGRTIVNQDGMSPSKPLGNIITNARPGQSWHNWGLAADIVPRNQEGQFTWDVPTEFWDNLANIGKSFGLEWGGSWDGTGKSLGDIDHFQLTGGLTIVQAETLGNTQAIWKAVGKKLGI